jgi:diguanylate cyclase (GGDEF)-like protein/PAS domain S-box-containing protein
MNPTIRLLYAEDNVQDADLTRSHFAQHAPEFEMQIVTTGAACLEQIRISPPDLLLLDHHLPDADGVEMLRVLLRIAPNLPIVIVTIVGDEDLAVQALRLGAAHYVPKQGNYVESLPDLLREVLEERHRQLSEGLPPTEVTRRILYVEHLSMDIDLTLRHFAEAAPHLDLDVVQTCAEALVRLAEDSAYDLALIDLRMPDQTGLEFVREAKRGGLPLPPFIMISGAGDEESAVAALKLGAADYIIKREGYLDELTYRIDHTIALEQINRGNDQLRAEIIDRKRAEDEMAEESERLKLVLDSSRLGLWDWNPATGELILDERWAEIVGYRPGELDPVTIDTWRRLSHPEDLPASDAAIEAHGRGETPFYDYEGRLRHRDGHWVWVRDRGRIVEYGPDGNPLRMTGTLEDITDRQLAEVALRASRAQLEQAQRIAHVGSWTLDLTTNDVTRSAELHLMQGTDPAGPELDYTESARLFTPESWLHFTTATAHAQETGASYELELEMVRPDGTRGWMLARGEAVRATDGAIVGVAGVALDITDRKAASDALQVLATHDPLTGLANRVALLDEITRAVSAGRRSGRSAAVLMMDLDRFKDVNDTLGHAAGDELLVAAATRIENIVRAGDLVARLGGDEFVVVMRDLDDPTEAVRAAGRLVEEFRAPFTPGGAELYATASVGVAIATDAGDAGDLLREADSAMYAAKEAGRDRVAVFNEDLRTAVTVRLAVEADLRHALDRGQLEVWYQPEVDLATGRMVAVEALLRWHHPDGDVWTADRFVDVAEDTGLILVIGDWVLRQACAQAAAWAVARPDRPITVRVNASALQLAEAGLLDAIDGALVASALNPAALCLEITETALIRQTATARENLDGIRDRGIGIAIDDFGTGYASLTYLRQYPIDILKIDRSFITHITTNDQDRRITAGIIALATTLGITVTAEGVEHPDQAALLRQMGCPGAQGWLYSKALPPEDVTPLLDHAFPHA